MFGTWGGSSPLHGSIFRHICILLNLNFETMKMLGKRNFELIADSFRTLGFSDYRDGMMNEEQMYVSEISEIIEFLKWLKESGMPFGSVNYEASFTAFKAETSEKPKESHRSIHKDLQYLELLKSFQASHKAAVPLRTSRQVTSAPMASWGTSTTTAK